MRVPVRLLLGGGLVLVSVRPAGDDRGGTSTSGWTVLIPGFVLGGRRHRLINPPLASTAIGVVHYSRSGMASGINSTFRQVGIVTGIAGLGAIFPHEVSHTVNSRLAASGQGQAVQSAAHGQLAQAAAVRRSRPGAARPPPCRLRQRSSTPTASASPKPSPRSSRSPPPIALAGAVCAFVLVRSRDFVSSAEPAAETAEPPHASPSGPGPGSVTRALSDRAARTPGSRAPAGAG